MYSLQSLHYQHSLLPWWHPRSKWWHLIDYIIVRKQYNTDDLDVCQTIKWYKPAWNSVSNYQLRNGKAPCQSDLMPVSWTSQQYWNSDKSPSARTCQITILKTVHLSNDGRIFVIPSTLRTSLVTSGTGSTKTMPPTEKSCLKSKQLSMQFSATTPRKTRVWYKRVRKTFQKELRRLQNQLE